MSNNDRRRARSLDHSERQEPGPASCAFCSSYRIRCRENCVMAPHFPAERMEEFQAVTRVFEARKVKKMIRDLKGNLEQQAKAVKSLVWEASMWEKDSVHGPLGEYNILMEEKRMLMERHGDYNRLLEETRLIRERLGEYNRLIKENRLLINILEIVRQPNFPMQAQESYTQLARSEDGVPYAAANHPGINYGPNPDAVLYHNKFGQSSTSRVRQTQMGDGAVNAEAMNTSGMTQETDDVAAVHLQGAFKDQV